MKLLSPEEVAAAVELLTADQLRALVDHTEPHSGNPHAFTRATAEWLLARLSPAAIRRAVAAGHGRNNLREALTPTRHWN